MNERRKERTKEQMNVFHINIFYVKKSSFKYTCPFYIGEIFLKKEVNIRDFSEKYAVEQGLVIKYLHHLAYLGPVA